MYNFCYKIKVYLLYSTLLVQTCSGHVIDHSLEIIIMCLCLNIIYLLLPKFNTQKRNFQAQKEPSRALVIKNIKFYTREKSIVSAVFLSCIFIYYFKVFIDEK